MMPSLDAPTAWYLAEWGARIGAVAFVPRRRPTAETRAWLLLIFFLPLVGLPLFAVIGSTRYPGWRSKRFDMTSFLQSEARSALALNPPDLGSSAPIAALARALGDLPAVSGNSVEMIEDYDAVIDRIVVDIEAATRQVHVLVYIFADDDVGTRIATALGRAVTRGVDVRVMLDPVGSHRWLKGTLALLRSNEVPVRLSLPFRFFAHRTRRDMRNHRKIIVIDERIGYAGSQNIVAKDFRPGIVNRELVARMTGPIVTALSTVVRGDWCLETGEYDEPCMPPSKATGAAVVQLLPSGPDYLLRGFETLLIWQLHQARRRVVIVTPYFIPSESLLDAMTIATARGVTIDLILSKVVDQRLVNLAQSSYYEAVMAAGVRVNLFRSQLLHAKNVSIDRHLAIVGSSNVDLRSFRLNEEVSLLFYDRTSIDRVIEIQEGCLRESDQIDPGRWRGRSPPRKMLENLSQLLSPLL